MPSVNGLRKNSEKESDHGHPWRLNVTSCPHPQVRAGPRSTEVSVDTSVKAEGDGRKTSGVPAAPGTGEYRRPVPDRHLNPSTVYSGPLSRAAREWAHQPYPS